MTRRVASCSIVLALVAGACGGDDDDASDATPAPSPTAATSDPGVPVTDGGAAPTDPAQPADPGTPGDTDGCAASGGRLTFAVPSLSTTLDPFSAAGGLGGDLAAIYDVVVRYDATTGEFEPRLAESVSSNDDTTVWTVVMREGATFGNGDPVDAAAVKASVDRHLAEGSASGLNSYAALIDEVVAVDDRTVEFHLTGAWGAFPFALTRGLGYITNVAVIDERGEEAFALDPSGAGAGAFEVSRWAAPESATLAAKQDWWGGDVCLDELEYVVIPDAGAAGDAFENGEVDAVLMDARAPLETARLKDVAAHSTSFIQHGGGVVMLNAGRGEEPPATADTRVRAAIAAAIDPNVIDERVWEGRGFPQTSLIQEASHIYTPLDGPAFDPERARELVAEVKAETGWDGTLRFDCVTNLAEAALTIKAMLDAVGFDVVLEANRTLPQQVELVVAGRFDVACFGHTPDEGDLWDGLRSYVSTNPRNLSGIASPELDATLDVLRQATTPDEVQAALADVQAVWNEVNPAVVYAAFDHVLAWTDAVDGIEFNYSTTVVGLFHRASVSR